MLGSRLQRGGSESARIPYSFGSGSANITRFDDNFGLAKFQIHNLPVIFTISITGTLNFLQIATFGQGNDPQHCRLPFIGKKSHTWRCRDNYRYLNSRLFERMNSSAFWPSVRKSSILRPELCHSSPNKKAESAPQ